MAESDPQQSQQQSPAEPPPAAPRTTRIFFGDDGLRPGWALLVYGALYFILYAVFGSAMAAFFPLPPLDSALFSPASILRGESAALAAVLLATWAMTRIEDRPWSSFGLGPKHVSGRMAAGAAFGAGLLALLVACLRMLGFLVFEGRMLRGPAMLGYALEWGLAFLIVAFFEETLFRGYLQATTARGLASLFRMAGAGRAASLGFWSAAVLLSFGFGFVHTENVGESVVGVLAAGVIGLVFCLSLWRSGSLWWAIGFHAAWDWAESFLFGVYDSGTLAKGRLLQTHPQGRPLFSGGLTGPEGSVLVLPTLLVMALAVLITLPPQEPAPEEAAVSSHIDLP